MKKARIALGVILVGVIISFLLSWPVGKLPCPTIQTITQFTTYDKTTPSRDSFPRIYFPDAKEPQVLLAAKNK